MCDAYKVPDQTWHAVTEIPQLGEVEGFLIDEFFNAIGLGGNSIWRRWFGVALSPVIHRFAQQAQAFDHSVGQVGLHRTAQAWLEKWTPGLRVEGEDRLPQSEPLLIAANHPGTFDGMATASVLRRDDLKIVAAGNPFFRALPNTRRYFVYSTLDTHVRAVTIRNALRHLKDGGALMIFSSGKLDPDPFYFPEAARQALNKWSESLELFLRKVPETRLVVAINSGFVAPEYLYHPFTRLRRSHEARQKWAEFIQIILQLLQDRRISNQPCVAYSHPVSLAQLSSAPSGFRAQVIDLAQRLIDQSLSSFGEIPNRLAQSAGTGSG